VRIVEHINIKNQGVKSRRVAGLIKKISHFRKGNPSLTLMKSIFNKVGAVTEPPADPGPRCTH
jgi:hypothetical protein